MNSTKSDFDPREAVMDEAQKFNEGYKKIKRRNPMKHLIPKKKKRK